MTASQHRNSVPGRGPCRPAHMVAFDYPPNDGGIARLGAGIVSRLAERRTIVVLSQRQTGPLSETDVPTGPGIQEMRVTPRRPLRELSAWWHLVRMPRGDTVIAGTWYTEGLIALLAGKRDLVVLAHGAELTPPVQPWRRRAWALLQRLVLTQSRRVVANSHYTASLVRASAPNARAVAIPLAVDHRRFKPGDRTQARARFGIPADATVIVTVCRIQAFKGIDVVLRAIAALAPTERENLVYLVAGQGSALADLQRLAHQLGIDGHVRWLGFVPDDELAAVYQASNLFALCTRERLDQRSVEGFGMVFLEAQACGIPVVGTRTGGIPDAIREGEGGWLIDQDDIPGLTVIVTDLMADPDQFEAAGKAARKRIERECTWDHYMTRFEEALAEVAEGG